MKIKTGIRQKISQSLDTLIPPNKWEQYIDLLDRDGKFTRKSLLALLLISCQQIEVLENAIEDLYFQLELKETPGVESKEPVREFKLRTPVEIYKDLVKDTKTVAFYVSKEDWKVLESAVDKDMAKLKPEYGFGKEVDPKDGQEKTCLYYQDLPIFRNLK